MTHGIKTTSCNPSRLAAFVCAVAVLRFFGVGEGWALASEAGNDVTRHVENLGNPFSRKYPRGEWVYARNIWDLHAYNERLYVGAGNSSNWGPAQNAGPVPIISFDPIKEDFTKEGTVKDEQIDVYYTFDGRLYIPGHDPTWPQTWKWGNFYYRQKNGRWKKHRNIPDAIHMYAMAWHKGKLFGGLGTREAAAVSISSDKGQTWTVVQTGGSRVYGFLTVAGGLYAVEMIPTPRKVERWPETLRASFLCVSEFKSPDRFVPRQDITAEALFPGFDFPTNRWMKVVRTQALGEKALYIGAYCHNDHQFLPFGVFLASSLVKGNLQVEQIPIPDGLRPWDLRVHGGEIYLLAEAKDGNKVQVRVLRSPVEDRTVWHEVLRFAAPTFARSFEILGGDFYFGLGCEIEDPQAWKQEELHPATGNILRVKAALVNSLPLRQKGSLNNGAHSDSHSAALRGRR